MAKISMRRALIEHMIRQVPGSCLTATCLAVHLNVKLSSLSSLLKKLTDENVLVRFEGVGPRGGYGYRLKEDMDTLSSIGLPDQ